MADHACRVDSAGLAAIDDLIGALARDGVTLAVARLKAPMRERFDAAGLTAGIGSQRFYRTVRAAVDAYLHERTRALV